MKPLRLKTQVPYARLWVGQAPLGRAGEIAQIDPCDIGNGKLRVQLGTRSREYELTDGPLDLRWRDDEIVAAVRDGTCLVYADGEPQGTGFLVEGDRLVATALHVVCPHEPEELSCLFLRANDAYLRRDVAGIVYVDKRRDLAVLALRKPVGDTTPLSISESVPAVGTSVGTVGNPGVGESVLEHLCLFGRIGWVKEHQIGLSFDANPGCSGGPLFRLDDGTPFAVMSFGYEDLKGVSFGLEIVSIRDQLRRWGRHEGELHRSLHVCTEDYRQFARQLGVVYAARWLAWLDHAIIALAVSKTKGQEPSDEELARLAYHLGATEDVLDRSRKNACLSRRVDRAFDEFLRVHRELLKMSAVAVKPGIIRRIIGVPDERALAAKFEQLLRALKTCEETLQDGSA